MESKLFTVMWQFEVLDLMSRLGLLYSSTKKKIFPTEQSSVGFLYYKYMFFLKFFKPKNTDLI